MDLEHLTKSQVILLAMLVAIVSSVATGIVTVSLMGQAPPQVAANVGNIIERTVQQIIFATTTIPAPSPTPSVPAPPNPASAIATVQKSVIRIVVQGDVEEKLVARGVIVSSKGAALTDAASLDPALAYEAILQSGAKVPIIRNNASSTDAFAHITLKLDTITSIFPATIVGATKLQLGSSVVRIGGARSDSVALGIIAVLPDIGSNSIQADISSLVPGSVLINSVGEVIGMTTTHSLTLGQNYYTLIK